MFKTAQDRILYSQAVEYIEQGRSDLVPPQALDDYLRQGLLTRDGGALALSEAGRREYRVARDERTAEG
ncbi:hypothetical protein IS481_07685 [Caldimonas thermodepolymerans]|jgi:hypothetical protein|uniref:Uncharacterized protein n=1 Tax=Caldimonas thermodepolymerans TaxID=215580 RepID=A0A2S5T713_9BURK|nr:hypothetical protein [Caldimonas thermodepolymerans]PPE70795.1 hypothetical protein C1702_04450 [Caldimonas thermodepolymerans]QPC33013.1 hypothetical protein IS481_07685 [Caldimonas thermodepolymerans]RDI03798.1 hypothetical protein DES46_101486 [Caldimonas thermodepolymerans]UZG45881.1 hypothetical protein ONZ46_08035 [Caldimonas thermodepolymerans]